MIRFIYDTETKEIRRQSPDYNPAMSTEVDPETGAVVINQLSRYIVCREVVEPQPEYDRKTQWLTSTTTVDEGLALIIRGWAVEPRPAKPPVPQWIDFGNAVMALPEVNQMLGQAITAAPALYGGITVGLGKAADGDARVFVGSWQAAFAAGLVSQELITTMQSLASTHDLPADFIAALSPPEG